MGDILLSLVLLTALAMLVARVPPTSPTGSLQGPARIVDGDSLIVSGFKVRLRGIDAPELAQTCTQNGASYPCGREAQAALARFVAGRTVICQTHGNDRYGRMLARCMAGTTELNRSMVEAGWALAYGDYTAQERAAKRAGQGVWQGEFMRPQDWRRNHDGTIEVQHDWFSDIWNRLSSLLGF